jgi:hypothetical protein
VLAERLSSVYVKVEADNEWISVQDSLSEVLYSKFQPVSLSSPLPEVHETTAEPVVMSDIPIDAGFLKGFTVSYVKVVLGMKYFAEPVTELIPELL